MPYATQADMTLRFGEDEIRQLTDRHAPLLGTIDTDVLARALSDADAIVDRYLGARYTVPLSAPLPADLVRIACDLARYCLHDLAVPEAVRTNYTDALAWLKAVATGALPLIASTGAMVGASSGAYGPTVVPYSTGGVFGSSFASAFLP